MRLAAKLVVPLCAFSMLIMLLILNSRIGTQENSVNNIVASDNGSSRRRFKSAPEVDEGPYGIVREQESRRHRVKNVCDRNSERLTNAIIPEKFSNLLVDDTHKILYCETPKVACTNWLRILYVISGKLNVSDPMQLQSAKVHGEYKKYLRKLSTYQPEEIQHRLEHYYKFMFVRNPLERILSAYYNKFTMQYNKYFPEKFGRRIIKRYRKNASQKSLRSGTDVKFPEFVQYLLDPATTEEKPFNEHWRQFYQLCRPCMVNYDYIGKYETINEDSEYILAQLGVDDLVKFPKRTTNAKTAKLLTEAYKDISLEDIHRLWELYKVDYAMFGYEYPDTSHH